MSGKFNYTYWRSRLRVQVVPKIPDYGSWFTVSDAAKYFGVSNTTVRHRYLKGELSIIRYRNLIYVNVSGKSPENGQ